MVPNARLIAHTQRTGVKGDGEPVFGVNRIGAAVPCQADEPSRHQAAEAARHGERLDLLIVVPRQAFVVGGRMPEPGDRMTVSRLALLGQETTADVIGVTDSGMGGATATLKIRLGERCDESLGGAA